MKWRRRRKRKVGKEDTGRSRLTSTVFRQVNESYEIMIAYCAGGGERRHGEWAAFHCIHLCIHVLLVIESALNFKERGYGVA